MSLYKSLSLNMSYVWLSFIVLFLSLGGKSYAAACESWQTSNKLLNRIQGPQKIKQSEQLECWEYVPKITKEVKELDEKLRSGLIDRDTHRLEKAKLVLERHSKYAKQIQRNNLKARKPSWCNILNDFKITSVSPKAYDKYLSAQDIMPADYAGIWSYPGVLGVGENSEIAYSEFAEAAALGSRRAMECLAKRASEKRISVYPWPQNKIARMYRDGDVLVKSDSKAIIWYEKSAKSRVASKREVEEYTYPGLADSKFNLGLILLSDTKTANNKRAIGLIREAAKQGHAKAQTKLKELEAGSDSDIQVHKGLAYINSRNYEEAYKWFVKAAEKDNKDAQFLLAWLYISGINMVKDNEEVYNWYKKTTTKYKTDDWSILISVARSGLEHVIDSSFEQSNADTQYTLGLMYLNGEFNGAGMDYKKAVTWFEQSAEQGHAQAQYNLAEMHLTRKVPKKEGYRRKSIDYDKAFFWHRKAAQQGHEKSLVQLTHYANSGYMRAQYDLGRFYYFLHKSKNRRDYSKWDVSDASVWMIVRQEIKRLGNNANLNHIDVSNVTKMDRMFQGVKFNGDISKWDVSNVTSMVAMFRGAKFNGDISKWDVSNVENMVTMFYNSEFNGDISKWNVSSVTGMGMQYMFADSKFDGDTSQWDMTGLANWQIENMFHKSKFPDPIEKWDMNDRAFGLVELSARQGHQKALYLLKKSAEIYPEAMYELGELYFKGKGKYSTYGSPARYTNPDSVDQDYNQSVQLLKKAAEYGNKRALDKFQLIFLKDIMLSGDLV